MSGNAAKRKRDRAYDATGRQERARQQREATLERARELFLAQGYAATTVESIAQAGGVSVATVYKTYGGKAGLVRELCTKALAGSGPVPAEQRSNALRVANDPRSLIEGWGALVEEVSPRVAPLLLLLRAAAETDPDAAALYAELDQERLDRMADNAHHLARHGNLRASISEADARDVLWLCTSPELYELLVQQRGWTPRQLGEFVTDTIASTIV
ncbi:MAG TPA: helix-turn-helix domain-containing protein [Microthrixaceae bacterium]|nr:helix-turn-helix domain-containing protein [Microthrixaceae bacterium]